MAYIVLIASGTYREGVNNIGDIVQVGDLPLGPAYSTFRVITVNATAAQVEAAIKQYLSGKTIPEPQPKYLLRYTHVSDAPTLTQLSTRLILNGN